MADKHEENITAMVRGIMKKLSLNDEEVDEKIMNVKGVSAYLKISERKVREMIADKVIPYARLGGCIRFDRDEINRWFKQNSEKSKVS